MTSIIAVSLVSLILAAQAFSTDPKDCVYEYRYEDSVLRFCSIKTKSELVHPNARFPIVEVYGYFQNISNHTWARVRFEINVEGVDAVNNVPFSHKWFVVRERIPKGATQTFSEQIPYNVELPQRLIGLKASVSVLDEYTFPKAELLQATLEAEREEEERLERTRALRDKQRLYQLQRQTIQQKSELARRCAVLFEATAQKKVGDITVVESQAIETCRSLGLYRALPKNSIKPSEKIQ